MCGLVGSGTAEGEGKGETSARVELWAGMSEAERNRVEDRRIGNELVMWTCWAA